MAAPTRLAHPAASLFLDGARGPLPLLHGDAVSSRNPLEGLNRATASASIPLSAASPLPAGPPPALSGCAGPFGLARLTGEHRGILASAPQSGARRRGTGGAVLLAGGLWEERSEVDCARGWGGSAPRPWPLHLEGGGQRGFVGKPRSETAGPSCGCFPTTSKMAVALQKALDLLKAFQGRMSLCRKIQVVTQNSAEFSPVFFLSR